MLNSNVIKISKIHRKTLLYKSNVEYADFCINHIEGCSHGCTFPCYAYIMKKRTGVIKNYNEWLKPKIVENALELLENEIPKYRSKIKFVHLCFSSDPFMYKISEISDLSLKIIKMLSSNNIKCTVLTKGVLPLELSDSTKYNPKNEYGITLVSLSNEFKKKYEPFSAPYDQRIKSLRDLSLKGLKTWVSIEPYPPSNIIEQDLGEILNQISFTDKIIFGKLNYNVKSSFYKFKEQELFYEKCVYQIIGFCKKNGIEHHIKFGTKKTNDPKTKAIFEHNLKTELLPNATF